MPKVRGGTYNSLFCVLCKFRNSCYEIQYSSKLFAHKCPIDELIEEYQIIKAELVSRARLSPKDSM